MVGCGMDAAPAIILRRRKGIVMKQRQIKQTVNGFIVNDFGDRIYVFETFQGLCDHLAVEFRVLLQAEEDSPTTKTTPPDMDIAKLGPKYAKADCCDHGKKVPCAFRIPFKDPSIPNSETKDMCSHGSLACVENKEVFEAINKPCHGGYMPKDNYSDPS